MSAGAGRVKTRAVNMSLAARGKTGVARKYELHECGLGAGERQAQPENMSYISEGAGRGEDWRTEYECGERHAQGI